MSHPETSLRVGLARQRCEVHRSHRPSILRGDGRCTVENHHVLPREYGGKSFFTWPDGRRETNTVWVCPTGHTAIHELLREWMRTGGDPGWMVRRFYSKSEQRWAAEGYRRWVATGRPALTREGHTHG